MNKTILKSVIIIFSLYFGNTVYGQNKSPKGKFILKNSECAGFNFVDDKIVLWTNEMFCNNPDTLKIRWIDNKNFITRTPDVKNKDCPPTVSYYQIVSFDGHKLVLKEIWMGWGDYKDEILEFTKQP